MVSAGAGADSGVPISNVPSTASGAGLGRGACEGDCTSSYPGAGAMLATSGCTAKAFFCSDEHLTAWRERTDPHGAGFRLLMEAALQVGKGLFVPMLADAAPGRL